jgi:thiamine-phosphate pyrophosphorylase
VTADRHAKLRAARLYLVCDTIGEDRLRAALRGGVDLVQLRCKDASDDAILAAARRFKAVLDPAGIPLIINDRPDLAVAADADGAHIGQDDIPVAAARALLGSERILGLSTHTPEQVDLVRPPAGDGGGGEIDYISVGPVNATPTKPGRAPVGLDLVRYAAAHAPVPFFAIGGIDADNVGAVSRAGAERIAVVRAITEALDPERAARALRVRLEVPVGTAQP